MGIALALRAGAYLQLVLALEGLLCRGGIAYGDVHMSEHFVFGPALIEAVEIEESLSSPQIALSTQVVAEARKAAASFSDPSEAFGQEVLIDRRERAFVDYLGYVATDDPDEFARFDVAARHRDVAREHREQRPVAYEVGVDGRVPQLRVQSPLGERR
jgi:hypothetical protein